LRTLAVLALAAALLTFTFLALVVGLPRAPEGPLLGPGMQSQIQWALLGLGAAAGLVGVRWQGVGGSLVLIAGAGIGVLAAFQYSPLVAFLAGLAFFVPGLMLLLAWQRTRSRWALLTLAACLAALLTAAGVFAWRAHAYAFGPTHPESPLRAAPVVAVEWVWSGGVTAGEARVTAKLADDDATVFLALSPSADLQGATLIAPSARARDGHLASFRASGLRPDTRYHYALQVDGRLDLTRRGTFRTFPAGPASFTVAVSACARTGSSGAVFDAIRRERALLYVEDGDLHYGNVTSGGANAYAALYDRTLRSPAQAALYRSTPVAYVWDDHDYGGNDAGADSPTREIAQTSYRDHVPHYGLPGGDETGSIQQAFTVGRLRFVLVDERSERSAPAAPGDPHATMLGPAQRRWFLDQVAAAAAAGQVVVWVSPDIWIEPAGAGGAGWGGYARERRLLADAIAGSGAPVVMLSGDAHMVAIDDGANSDYTTDRSGGFPVLQAGALDRHGAVKGGPYSEGAIAGSGQYGTLEIHDEGSQRIAIVLRAKDWRGRTLLVHRLHVRVPAAR
jgi:phosphodiesterase/alkaline phosphatase D-like protein